jgi:hypothetical protein
MADETEMRNTWGSSGKRAETDKEWIARGGQLGTVWDAIDKGRKEVIDWLAPVRASNSPEYDFWTEFFTLTIQDAQGISPGADKVCLQCHIESGDGCFSAGKRGMYYNRRRKWQVCHWVSHTVQQCAQTYIAGQMAEEDCALLGIEVSYLRKLLRPEVE